MPEHAADVQTRLGPRLLETPPILADDDRLVLFPLYPDQHVDQGAPLLFNESFDLPR